MRHLLTHEETEQFLGASLTRRMGVSSHVHAGLMPLPLPNNFELLMVGHARHHTQTIFSLLPPADNTGAYDYMEGLDSSKPTKSGVWGRT